MNVKAFAVAFCLLTLIINELTAQPPFKRGGGGPKIVGKIQGTIFDNESKESINFATVALREIGDTTDIDGMITDSKGQFKLTEVKMGKYQISIAFIGYETKVITDIELTPRRPDANLGKIYLETDQVVLDQVEVVGQKAVVENKVDRIVYNAENDETLIGGDATDVLQNVPMLAVDNDGNVSLRGSENITILVNGKISGMFSTNVGDALKMFPADQIKSVEVITSPGAKYDAEGSAGLINIITKNKRFEGYSVNVNGTLGNRINRGSINANVAKGRFGFNAAGNAYYSWPLESNNTFSRTSTISSIIDNYDQNGKSERERLGFFGQAGAYYDFNAYNSINSSFNLRGFTSRSDGVLDIDILNASEDIQSLREQFTDQGRTGFEWNTDYTKKFQTDGQEFSFAFQLNASLENNEYEMRENASNELIAGENAMNDGDNYQYTFQMDYAHPLGKGNKLELGAKSIIRDIESQFENTDVINPAFNLGDNFKYDQDVWSLYSQGNINLGNGFSSIIGLRYEHTDIKGSYLSGEPSDFDNDYDNLFPQFYSF